MKVVFGTDSIKYPLTGIGRYTYELAKELERSSDISELLFLNGRRVSQSIPELALKEEQNAKVRNFVKNSLFLSELYRYVSPWLKK